MSSQPTVKAEVKAAASQPVVAAVSELFAGIVSKDVDAVLARYLHGDRLLVFLEGPKSKAEGWNEALLREAWQSLFTAVTFSEIRLEADVRSSGGDTVGYVAATILARYGSADQDPFHHRTVSNRGTWVLEKVAGDWLIVHEHVSFPVPDPYPTG